MRFLLTIKWALIALLTALGLLLAAPLLFVFTWLNSEDTAGYLGRIAGEMFCAFLTDFRELRLRQPAEDRHGLVWLALSLVLVAAVTYLGVQR